MKIFGALVGFFAVSLCYGQNIRMIRDFEALPLNGKKFEVISKIESDFPDFKVKKRYGKEIFWDGNRSAIQYESTSLEIITLIFYKDFLYDKRLEILYPTVQYGGIAFKEFENLNEHIKSTHTVLKQMESMSRSLSGEQDGQGFSYITEMIGNRPSRNVGVMYRRLINREGTSGFIVEFNSTDVSKTEYELDGLSTPELR